MHPQRKTARTDARTTQLSAWHPGTDLHPYREPAKLSRVRMVLLGKESVMRNHVLSSAAVLTLLALPLAACQSGTTAGAAGGAVTGAIVGGPVGAVVGGVAGAAAGSVLSAEESTRVRSYVVAERPIGRAH